MKGKPSFSPRNTDTIGLRELLSCLGCGSADITANHLKSKEELAEFAITGKCVVCQKREKGVEAIARKRMAERREARDARRAEEKNPVKLTEKEAEAQRLGDEAVDQKLEEAQGEIDKLQRETAKEEEEEKLLDDFTTQEEKALKEKDN